MSESILKSVKKLLGVAEDYTVFDLDITMYINSALSTLNQLGIGPDLGFAISGEAETWEDFIGLDPRLNSVQQYVTLRVKMIFDPPESGVAIAAFEKQIEEYGWRLNVVREGDSWTDPDPVVIVEEV